MTAFTLRTASYVAILPLLQKSCRVRFLQHFCRTTRAAWFSHLTSMVSQNPLMFSKNLIQTFHVPTPLDGAKILSKSSTPCTNDTVWCRSLRRRAARCRTVTCVYIQHRMAPYLVWTALSLSATCSYLSQYGGWLNRLDFWRGNYHWPHWHCFRWWTQSSPLNQGYLVGKRSVTLLNHFENYRETR